MTLLELVHDVYEKTHLEHEEIVELVREAWPDKSEFTPTQAKLMVRSIDKRRSA